MLHQSGKQPAAHNSYLHTADKYSQGSTLRHGVTNPGASYRSELAYMAATEAALLRCLLLSVMGMLVCCRRLIRPTAARPVISREQSAEEES